MTIKSAGMLKRLFSFPHANRDVTDRLYAEIVAAARQPMLYSEFEAPDTPLGRFEMLSLHMLLVQRRLLVGKGLRELAQDLTDTFFADVDDSLRQFGIGDMGIPKRMKKLARMFYGRVESYAAALDGNDKAALCLALTRNVRPDVQSWPQVALLADYAFAAAASLSRHDDSAFLAGRAGLPGIPVRVEEGAAL